MATVKDKYADIRAMIGRQEYDAALRAIEQLGQAQEFSPDILVLKANLILLVSSPGLYELKDAEEAYHRALELSPDNADAHLDLGYFYLNILDNPSSAQPHFLQAEQLLREAYVKAIVAVGESIAELEGSHAATEHLVREARWVAEAPDLQDALANIQGGGL